MTTAITPAGGAGEFIQLAKALLEFRGNRSEAIGHLEQSSRPTSARVISVLKAASAAGTTSDPLWAGSLVGYRTLQSGFLESLRSSSAFDAMIGAMQIIPEGVRVIVVAGSATASEVGEASPKPVTALSISGADLPSKKVAALIVVSDELLAQPEVDALLGRELRRAVGVASDQVFLTDIAVGAPTIAATADLLGDLRSALGGMVLGADSRLFLVAPPIVAAQLGLLTATDGSLLLPEGTLGAIVPIASAALTDTAVLADATQLVAISGPVTLDYSAHASVEMLDSALTGVATVSLWQQNLRALKIERWLAAKSGRVEAVTKFTGVGAWTA